MDLSALPPIRPWLPDTVDGLYVFVGAGGAIGAVVALVLFLPWILPRLSGARYRFRRADHERLAAALPVFATLDKRQRKHLTRLVKDFLAQVSIKSKGERVPPIMRVGIAGHACSLRLQARRKPWPGLKTVWLDAPRKRDNRRRIQLEERGAQLAMGGDEQNLIVRRFAARLFPLLHKRRFAPRGWQAGWLNLLREQPPEASALLGDSSEKTPGELFALACEAYMQRGPELKAQHPQLYTHLQTLLLVDTANGPRTEFKE